MIRKKKIRTFIITGRRIFAVLIGFLCITVIAIFLSLAAKFPTISPEQSKIVLRMGLNDIKWDFLKIKRILGIEFGDNISIIKNYHGIFGEVKNVEAKKPERVVDLTLEASTPETPEVKVSEMNGAKGMAVSNLSGISVDAENLSREKIDIAFDSSGPQVLIVHTHTTESFSTPNAEGHTVSGNDRTTDSEKNMVAVGRVIKDVLESEGIGVIHDTTVHDYPSYNGAYTRSMTTVEKNLKAHPTIKLVLDVHRDGIVGENGEKVKVLAEINGEKAAQCMFVVGSNAVLPHDEWILNMRLACNLQRYANENYPGLMRAINLRKERFNQQVPARSIIIEVGSNGNTLLEAKVGASFVAKTIIGVVRGK